MTKQDVLNQFATDFNDPGSEKSGEYLETHVLDRARQIVSDDRPGLMDVMRDWMEPRRYPHTLLAVAVARELRLTEMRAELEQLSGDVDAGKALRPHDRAVVDEALAALDA